MSSFVTEPVFKNGVLGNLQFTEMVATATSAYAGYRCLTVHKDLITTLTVCVPAALMLNVALGSKSEYGTATREDFKVKNFDLFELLTIASLVYGGVRLLTIHNDTIAAVGAFATAAMAVYASSGKAENYL